MGGGPAVTGRLSQAAGAPAASRGARQSQDPGGCHGREPGAEAAVSGTCRAGKMPSGWEEAWLLTRAPWAFAGGHIQAEGGGEAHGRPAFLPLDLPALLPARVSSRRHRAEGHDPGGVTQGWGGYCHAAPSCQVSSSSPISKCLGFKSFTSGPGWICPGVSQEGDP